MGVFDTLVDGENSVQIKCYPSVSCKTFKVGDKLPIRRTLTILFPDYEGALFAIIEKGVFKGLTNDYTKVKPPYISKWGKKCSSINDIYEWNLIPQQKKLKKMIKERKNAVN